MLGRRAPASDTAAEWSASQLLHATAAYAALARAAIGGAWSPERLAATLAAAGVPPELHATIADWLRAREPDLLQLLARSTAAISQGQLRDFDWRLHVRAAVCAAAGSSSSGGDDDDAHACTHAMLQMQQQLMMIMMMMTAMLCTYGDALMLTAAATTMPHVRNDVAADDDPDDGDDDGKGDSATARTANDRNNVALFWRRRCCSRSSRDDRFRDGSSPLSSRCSRCTARRSRRLRYHGAALHRARCPLRGPVQCARSLRLSRRSRRNAAGHFQ